MNCGLGLDLCFAALSFLASNYRLKLVKPALSKAHQAISSLWGVRICLLVWSHCDPLTPWSVVTMVLEISGVPVLTRMLLCKLLKAQSFNKDGEQISHLLQYSYLGPHLITGTLLVKEFNNHFSYPF